MKISQILKETRFSKRLVFIYTCIIVIPLFIVVLAICGVIGKNEYAELRQRCSESLLTNTKKIEANLDSFDLLEQMIITNKELMLFLIVPESTAPKDFVEYVIERTNLVESILSVLPQIYSLRIFTDNPLIPERWPVFLKTDRTDLVDLHKWEFNYNADFMGNLDQLKLNSLCSTRKIIKNKRDVGYLQISMRMTDFFPFLYDKKNKTDNNDFVFQIVQNGQNKNLVQIRNEEQEGIISSKIISAEEIIFLEKMFLAKKFDNVKEFTGKIFGTDSFIAGKIIDDVNILVIHTNTMNTYVKNITLIFSVLLLGFIVTMFLLYFVIRSTTKKLMSGVYSVINGMKRIREGDYEIRLPVIRNDEVGETQKTFNLMVEQIQSQIEQIKIEQELIADTEIKAMQNQINVHFLYNVLETIKMQAVIAEQEDIVESMTILGKMMRYCLRWKVHIVSLEQEMDYALSYIYILNLRNDYKISLLTEMNPEFFSIKVPKMILQPLIENSYIHTIEPEGKDAVIKIFTKTDEINHKFYLCEQDFGCGMNSEQLEKIKSYLADSKFEKDSVGSIGLKNIQQRLTMTYGKDFKIKIESEEGKGTLICIPLPLP
ncbi:MAG: histidine kinase [Treponema sp.]|jgi:two-component system, sensor histidine kinase YesM|nr:histidine kinase [Treponema sp.]